MRHYEVNELKFDEVFTSHKLSEDGEVYPVYFDSNDGHNIKLELKIFGCYENGGYTCETLELVSAYDCTEDEDIYIDGDIDIFCDDISYVDYDEWDRFDR